MILPDVVKLPYNIIVICIIVMVVFTYTHGFEQWLLEKGLSFLKIRQFSNYVSLSMSSWLPTILVGFLVSVFISIFTLGPGKIWWIFAMVLALSLYSYFIRITFWEPIAPIGFRALELARHVMYILGAALALGLIRLIRNGPQRS